MQQRMAGGKEKIVELIERKEQSRVRWYQRKAREKRKILEEKRKPTASNIRLKTTGKNDRVIAPQNHKNRCVRIFKR